MKYLISFSMTLLFSGLFLYSCIKEGMGNCPDYDTYNIRVVLDKDAAIPVADESDINHIDLYVFNTYGDLIGKIGNVSLNNWVKVDYPSIGNLKFVAVANAGNNVTVSINDSSVNDHISKCSISLNIAEEFNSDLIFHAPDDIFWGTIGMENKDNQSENRDLPIHRIVSGINVKIKGLPEYTMHLLDLPLVPDEEDFRYIIETRHQSVDFDGKVCGTSVRYRGNNILKHDRMCEIPTFNMFSTATGEDVIVHIFYNDILVDSVSEAQPLTRNPGSNKLLAYNGKLLEVFINYSAGVQVILQNVNWWGSETLWKDF